MLQISARSADVGQVDKEDLVKAAFAHQFRRQLADSVGGGDDKDRRFLLLQPGDEAAKDAAGCAGVADIAGADAGKALLDLVHPEHDGRNALRHLDGIAQIFFAGADQRSERAGPRRAAAGAAARSWRPTWRPVTCRSPGRRPAGCPWVRAGQRRALRRQRRARACAATPSARPARRRWPAARRWR